MNRLPAAPPPVETIEVVLTAASGTIPFIVTAWQFPSGNVQEAIYNKEKIAALPEDVRKALEAAYELFEKLRGHRGEIIE